MKQIELIISSELGNILKVEGFLEQIMSEFDVEDRDRAKVALSVVEAVNNSILYGNKLNPAKKVELKAEKDGDKLTVTVRDEGEGFEYWKIPDPTTPANIMKIAGRGLYLMMTLTDDLLFHQNGKEVIMMFNLKKEEI